MGTTSFVSLCVSVCVCVRVYVCVCARWGVLFNLKHSVILKTVLLVLLFITVTLLC